MFIYVCTRTQACYPDLPKLFNQGLGLQVIRDIKRSGYSLTQHLVEGLADDVSAELTPKEASRPV